MGDPDMKSTMKDVSTCAGVSVATVSHVINNTKYVTEDMRRRVLDAVRTLDYKPNICARNFKMGKQMTIGFVVPDISNPFFSTLIDDVEGVVSRYGYMIIVINTKDNPEKERQQLRRLTSGLVDGLVVVSAFDCFSMMEEAIPQGFPLVLLYRKPKNCALDTVRISDYEAIYRGVENLIHRGHRKIGCITGSQHYSTMEERFAAFSNCLRDYGLPSFEEGILKVDLARKHLLPDLRAYFFRPDITALVILNNTLTFEIFNFIAGSRIKLGQDLEAMGYGDESSHDFVIKHIDLINQPVHIMGSMVGERIIERIRDPTIPVREVLLKADYEARREN
jgi:LacI family transcriptional regulator